MKSLERALIEKAGYAHGWENVRESAPERVVLYSARHTAEAHVKPTESPYNWRVSFPHGPSAGELARTFPAKHMGGTAFHAAGEQALGRLLRRAAELAMALPNHAADTYAAEVAKIEAHPPSTTEVLALVKQRRGQDIFRSALMDYWGGSCAVTGIAFSELLRASHAKPWAKCDTDQERLNVFNGFLLCAHLDALFDRGLFTFTDDGAIELSGALSPEVAHRLGLSPTDRLRWIAPQHLLFLAWHRENVFAASSKPGEHASATQAINECPQETQATEEEY